MDPYAFQQCKVEVEIPIVSELIPNYVLHCISIHWVLVFVCLLVNQLHVQFWKRSISDIIKVIKPIVKVRSDHHNCNLASKSFGTYRMLEL